MHLTDKALAFELKYRQQSRQFMDELFEGISTEDLAVARQVLNRLDRNLRALAASDGLKGEEA